MRTGHHAGYFIVTEDFESEVKMAMHKTCYCLIIIASADGCQNDSLTAFNTCIDDKANHDDIPGLG